MPYRGGGVGILVPPPQLNWRGVQCRLLLLWEQDCVYYVDHTI